LTLRVLDEANTTPIARNDIDWQHIKHVPIQQVHNCEIEIRSTVGASNHESPIGLRASRIDAMQALCRIVPGALDLEAKQDTALFNREVIGKAVSSWPEDPKAPLEELGDHGRFRNIGFELGVQLTMSPTSYLAAPPRSEDEKASVRLYDDGGKRVNQNCGRNRCQTLFPL